MSYRYIAFVPAFCSAKVVLVTEEKIEDLQKQREMLLSEGEVQGNLCYHCSKEIEFEQVLDESFKEFDVTETESDEDGEFEDDD